MNKKTRLLAAVALTSAVVIPAVHADADPFQQATVLANAHEEKDGEGKCGEGKCGEMDGGEKGGKDDKGDAAPKS